MASSLEDFTEDEEAIRKELGDIPLEELQKIRSRIGTKKFDSALKSSLAERSTTSFKRANKNRPSEVSSERPVSQFREVVPILKKKEETCDPRFSETAGKFNNDLFKKSFNFIDEMKKKEKFLLQKEAKKTRSVEKKRKLHALLNKMESREAAAAKEDRVQAIVRQHKKEEREKSKKGKKPFYIKKSTIKQLELAEKYTELKKSGKLGRYLNKKRKKNAQRDKRKLPFKR